MNRRLNRYGLVFVDNKSPTRYKTTGLRFASYYRLVCTRCGWSFAGRRWEKHSHAECDQTIRQLKMDDTRHRLPDVREMNLHGRRVIR